MRIVLMQELFDPQVIMLLVLVGYLGAWVHVYQRIRGYVFLCLLSMSADLPGDLRAVGCCWK